VLLLLLLLLLPRLLPPCRSAPLLLLMVAAAVDGLMAHPSLSTAKNNVASDPVLGAARFACASYAATASVSGVYWCTNSI
jgi:hypothetical protein